MAGTPSSMSGQGSGYFNSLVAGGGSSGGSGPAMSSIGGMNVPERTGSNMGGDLGGMAGSIAGMMGGGGGSSANLELYHTASKEMEQYQLLKELMQDARRTAADARSGKMTSFRGPSKQLRPTQLQQQVMDRFQGMMDNTQKGISGTQQNLLQRGQQALMGGGGQGSTPLNGQGDKSKPQGMAAIAMLLNDEGHKVNKQILEIISGLT